MCIVSPCLSWFSNSYFNCLLVSIKERTFKIIAWQLSAIQVHWLLWEVLSSERFTDRCPRPTLSIYSNWSGSTSLTSSSSTSWSSFSFLFPHCHDLSSLSIVRPQPMYTSLSTPPHLLTNFINTIVRIITITICFTCAVHQSLLKKIISFVDALPSLSFLSHDDEDERIIQYFWHQK